jgi:hypothetical protein
MEWENKIKFIDQLKHPLDTKTQRKAALFSLEKKTDKIFKSEYEMMV